MIVILRDRATPDQVAEMLQAFGTYKVSCGRRA